MTSLVKIPKFHEHFHEILVKSHQTTIFLGSQRLHGQKSPQRAGPWAIAWAIALGEVPAHLAALWRRNGAMALQRPMFQWGYPRYGHGVFCELTGDFYGIKHIL